MRFRPLSFAASTLLIMSTSAAFANPKVRRGPTSPHLAKARATKSKASAQGINPERATQIQTALIKAGYMSGTPSGKWDASTEAAMQKLQADNGWQTKLVPDSRAIIKLGLGSSAAASQAASSSETSDAPALAPSEPISSSSQ